jgi:hypothetical protein
MTKRSGTQRVFAVASISAAGVLFWGAACEQPQRAQDSKSASHQAPELAAEPTTQSVPPETAEWLNRLAQAIVRASPSPGADGPSHRDEAGTKLSRMGDLIDMADQRILWGQFESRKGYDPADYRMLALPPEVWARLYLSCFTFSGKYELRQVGSFSIVELPARFRAQLNPGEYPHPFWHSQQEWKGYVNAESVLLVAASDRLIGAFLKSSDSGEGDAASPRAWDDRWTWQDENGNRQPRVAEYPYQFSSENPHLRTLDAAYRKLEPLFESQGCFKCHTPANRSKSDVLVLLGYPNQALAARESLVEVLEKNSMPPAEPSRGWSRGIRDETIRLEMLRAAQEFRAEGDAALSYEGVKIERAEEWPAAPGQ